MKNLTLSKILIAVVFLLMFVFELNAQKRTATFKTANKKNADTTSPTSTVGGISASSYTLDDPNDSVIENRLVQLALAQPQYEQAAFQRNIIDLQLKKQRQVWLNLLTLSLNYNDQTFAKNNTPSTYVYPKYFFGLNVPLGLIFGNGTDVKITKQSALIAKDQQIELAKTIKQNVLSNYKQYKASVKLLALQMQVVDDEQANFLQVEQKFKEGTATIDAYNSASKNYNDDVVKVVNLQLQIDLYKLEIERLIGRKFEDIFK